MIQSSDEGKDLESKRNILLRQKKKKTSKEGEALKAEELGKTGKWAEGGSGQNGRDVNSQFSNETDSSDKERTSL